MLYFSSHYLTTTTVTKVASLKPGEIYYLILKLFIIFIITFRIKLYNVPTSRAPTSLSILDKKANAKRYFKINEL